MASNETEQPIPVERVELKKYTGLWYEIAKIPNRFQKKCAGNTSAFYSLRKDGRIDVVNRCIGRDNEQSEAKGVAKVVDKKSNAKLKVSFVKLFGISLFWGDYWIIGLDKDYTYAVVGTPDRKYGWILSRTRTLSEEQLDRIFSLLRKQGYNPDDFEMTKHSPLSNKALAP
ncbi:MAG: lipocalin family protein [Candidatus Eisenbacteria bacterium]|uniref:Lipocalin family protein n=1 Tax=Eiseniibacteriota bacterium TaxID=2212470 RepID=A0A948W583_UNCEI|nr:lipocalin family protein [Candidatus Eisenbacteria bacterium]MBU1948505.1 lipocalin family protein [Candidatus Eisenbacteria bacterium]MBU2689321.1 lipocalin family protein [Candidatus Eisenbacteria bacterium]